ncbi:MAG: hypothetical protein IJ718_04815 [Paludibacteraceae bacterium]|nr:hypothetical protein [Paludibacteraceae bacterium]
MKRNLIISIFAFFAVALLAEDRIGSYTMSYFDGKEYEIEASEPKNGKFSIYLYVGGDRKSDKVCIGIDSKDLQAFKTSLEQIRDKFLEWEKTAKDNNVTDINKDFPYSFPKVTIAWLGSKWWFSFNKHLKPKFMVFKDGSCAMVVYMKVKASSNEYIDQDVYWVLQNVDEFNSIIDMLDENIVMEHYNNKGNKTDLFQ